MLTGAIATTLHITKETAMRQPKRRIVKVLDGKICDYVDGKFRQDTPEEYVRQTIEKRLVNEHQYKAEQVKKRAICRTAS